MKYAELGASGIKASVVGFGAWVTGGGAWWGGKPDDSESIRAIEAALDAGVTLFDTAPAYGFGHSEEIVGQAINKRRGSVVIATKCGLWWDDLRGSPFVSIDGHDLRRSLRPDTIRVELENSLRRLKTDYIDLYQTHWPSVPPDQTPIPETMGCLMDLKRQGKIRAIGVCNLSIPEMAQYAAAGDVVSHQFRYSMLYRAAEAEVLGESVKRQQATLTYMSLEQGLLTGKVGMDRQFAPSEFRMNADWNPWYKIENRRRILDLLDGWKDLRAKYDCTQAQLSIAWTLAQTGVTHILCGARKAAQILDNVAGSDLALETSDLARMRKDVENLGAPG